MNQNLVSLHVAAESIGHEFVARRQIQNDNGPVAVTGVAEAFGEALAVLRSKMSAAAVDDIVYAFRKGLTGERA